MNVAVHSALAAGMLMLASCGGGASDDKTAVGDNAAAAENDDTPAATASTASWPSNAPDYAPPYPGASIENQYATQADKLDAVTVVFTTRDSAEKVAAFYRPRARAAGLVKEMNMATGNDGLFHAQDASGARMVSVATKATDGVTTVTLGFTRGGR